MKHVFAIVCLLALSICCAAQHSLHGTVVSKKDSMPIAGVTITVLNSQAETATDNKGRFALTVGGVTCNLRVSAMGYQTTTVDISLPSHAPLLIYLSKQTEMLEEVIVSTGYQQLSRERAVGSFSHIDNRLFNEQVGTDVISRLEAIGNGISVNRNSITPKLMVRGLSTINGPAEPLIILDNFPYEGDLSNINPNDVADISILKDAAAASIWGTRAGNGVVVITTKKGRLNEPISVSFNANTSIGDKPDFNYLRWLSSAEFIDLEMFLFEQGYYQSDMTNFFRPLLSPVIELLAQRRIAQPDAIPAIDAQIEQMKQHDVRDDFKNHLYGRSHSQQYALGFRGGSEQVAWNASAGYDRNRGSLDDLYNRLNLKFSNQMEITKNLRLFAGVSLTQSNQYGGKPAWNEISPGTKQLYPYARLMDEQGNALAIPKEFRQAYLDTAGGGLLLDWRYRPLDDYRHTDMVSKAQHIVTHAGIRLNPINALSFDLNYQFERQYSNNSSVYGANSYFARDLINRFTEIDVTTGGLTRHIPVGGVKDRSSSELNVHNVRAQANFDTKVGEHTLSAMLGGEVRQVHLSSNGHRLYGYNDDILAFGSVDFISQFPQFVSGFPARILQNVSEGDQTDRFVSAYGNASYTFSGRYTLYTSLRTDASNLYGVRTNNKWKPLWSTGVTWDVAAEKFFPWRKMIPRLKVRATYGVSGNADPTQTAITTMTFGTLSPYTGSPYATFRTYGNPQLQWETVRTLNLGVDFAMAANRVYGSIEYYRKWADDLFGSSPIDMTIGIGRTVKKNVAAMRAQGMDIDLNARIIDRDFRWTANMNLNHYTDRVTDYFLATNQGSNYTSNNGSIVTGLEGKPVYSLLSYRWAGLDPVTGDPQGVFQGETSTDYNALTGSSLVIDDLFFHGSALPKWMGSFGNTFAYAGVSVTFRFMYKFGHYFRKDALNYGNLYSRWQMHAEYANRWQAPGDEQYTNVPSRVYPNTASRDNFYQGATVNVLRGDHIRLQYINVNYQLNGLRNTRLKTMDIYATADNIGILWRKNKLGLDPEYFGANSLPPAVRIAVGIRATF